MSSQDQISTIQAYLRENARRQYETVSLPPFTAYFHPADSNIYFNYAIPDMPVCGDQKMVLLQLVAEFNKRGCLPRFEFLLEFAPDLPTTLIAEGFLETERQWNMLCTPTRLKPEPPDSGARIIPLNPESPAGDIRDYIIAQRQGFNPSDTTTPSDKDIHQVRMDVLVGGWQPFLARVNGEPAGAAALGRIITGVSEIAGIATRSPFRHRGIATSLTWLATSEAYHQGAHTTCLTAADAAAGRIYERLGYQPTATMLSFSHPQTYDHPIAP